MQTKKAEISQMSGFQANHDPQWNLLVLSDLHLGDQLPGESRERVEWNASFVSHHFSAFLEHYTEHREQNKPWRLLIAGDMIDFMRTHVTHNVNPDVSKDSSTQWHLPNHRIEGSLQKLKQVFHLHPKAFECLGQFIVRGNEVVLITGNHDAELNWIEIQESFRENMFTITCSEQLHCDREVFYQRIRFMPWFYYEPERIYVEHGHLYDQYCNIENFLTLEDTEEEAEKTILSFSHFMTHYQFRSEQAFSGLPLEHLDQWTPLQMAQWLIKRPTQQKLQITVQIVSMIFCLVRTAWNARFRQASALPPQKKQRVFRQIAHQQELPVEAIEPLQQFITVPLHTRFFDTIQALYLDRISLMGITVFLVLVALVAPWAAHWRAALLTVTATGFVATYSRLAKRHPVAGSAPALLGAAYRISSYVNAPLIVFGHSHQFERRWLCENQLYVNIGSWLPPSPSDGAEYKTVEELTELPHTPPMEMPSVTNFETPYLIVTTDKNKHTTSIGRWSHQGSPTLQPLAPQSTETCS